MSAETSRDVAHIVAGAGYAGCLLALLLKRAGYEVLVLEKAESNAITPDDRHFGITRETRILLQELGLWQQMQDQCTPIAAMHIHTPADPERAWLSLGQEDDYVIGCVIPARLLHRVLRMAVADAGVMVLFETRIACLEQRTQRVEVTTNRGEIFTAPLLVAADGMHSHTRELAEIALEIKDYHQCAEQWKIVHENPHQNAAYEYLLPHGPYVVLPTTAPCTSKLIWCHKEDGAEYNLESQLIAHFPPALGEVSLLEHIGTYPLNLQRAKSSHNGRVVLIGDAYQRVHPVAAQGLNIGLRDAQALAASLIDAQRLGLDHGAPHRLAGFHQQRRFDRFLVRSLTDFLGDKASFNTPLFWCLHRVLGKLLATRPAHRLIREIFHGE